jgi:hypothetical protein
LAAVAPAVLFKAFDILVTPTFFFASDFSSRTSDEVHARLINFLAISISFLFVRAALSITRILFGNTPNSHCTDTFMSTPKQSSLCDQLSETISAAIRLVREIFATERPTETATDSIRISCAQTKISK